MIAPIHRIAAWTTLLLLGANAMAASVTCQSRNNQREDCRLQGRGEVVLVRQEGGSWKIAIRARAEMAPFIAEKGSITVNGVSLTVNDVRDRADGMCDFLLNIIPHTAEVTTLGDLAVGDTVNLEIDVLARYLKRMQSLAAMR